jgi:hypothetical protein
LFDILEIDNLNEKQFKSLIGIPRLHFGDLLLRISSKIKKRENRGRDSKYSLKGRVIITMVWLRHYLKPIIFRLLFNISDSVVRNYSDQIIDILYTLSFDSFHNHTIDRLNQKSIFYDRFNEPCIVTAIVDGSEQRAVVSLNK